LQPFAATEIEMDIATFSVLSMCTFRETAYYSLDEEFCIASTEPRQISARFLNDLTIKVVENEEESGERPSK